VPDLRRLLADFEALLKPRSFDPATAQRTVRICCNYFERAILLPQLVRRLRAESPALKIEILTADTDGYRTLLEGTADLLLTPVVADQSGLMVRNLLAEHYVCVMHRDDPRRDHFDMDTYRAAEHIAIEYDRGWTPFYRRTLAELGVHISPVVTLPSFGAVRELMMVGDFVLTVPSRVAKLFEPDFCSVPAPFDAGFSLKLFWPEKDQTDPYSRWLRGLVLDVCSDLAG
jgi:DNA-binding transcriptional LysR family regulator